MKKSLIILMLVAFVACGCDIFNIILGSPHKDKKPKALFPIQEEEQKEAIPEPPNPPKPEPPPTPSEPKPEPEQTSPDDSEDEDEEEEKETPNEIPDFEEIEERKVYLVGQY